MAQLREWDKPKLAAGLEHWSSLWKSSVLVSLLTRGKAFYIPHERENSGIRVDTILPTQIDQRVSDRRAHVPHVPSPFPRVSEPPLTTDWWSAVPAIQPPALALPRRGRRCVDQARRPVGRQGGQDPAPLSSYWVTPILQAPVHLQPTKPDPCINQYAYSKIYVSSYLFNPL